MDLQIPFYTLNYLCDAAVILLDQLLVGNGLQVLKTFDLHETRLDIQGCSCLHHGTNQCDCQMVVLLVYGKASEPTTLILHGSGERTWLSLVNNSFQHADNALQELIENAIQQYTIQKEIK